MPDTALSLSHVSLFYEHDVQALHDVSLDVRSGERLCVLGPNGSGKSTLASVLCGLLAPDEGDVTLVGERVLSGGDVDYEAYRRARRRLGLVFQNPDDQIVTTVVEEDVAFGPENLGVPADQIGARVRRELHRVALDDYAKADPTRLSGGQKQRVAIAGALAMEPDVVVYDEPGALLDVRGRRSIMHVMDRLARTGVTQVHITHFMEEALAADRVVVMDAGAIVLQGTPREVFSHADELRALGLSAPFAADLAERLRAYGVDVPWTCDDAELQDAIVRACRGDGTRGPAGERGAAASPAVPAAAGGVPAVRAEGVSYSYAGTGPAGRRALDGVSLDVPRGAMCSIVGQTGSGKSTLLRLLCALEVPDEGRVLVGELDTRDRRQRRLVHGRVGYVMQHPERQLFAETVGEDVAYGPRNLRLPAREVEGRCRRALELVGLSGRESVSPFELSGGQRRLCAIAGILAMHPETLVLDEPTAGLDPHGRAELYRILRDLNDRGVTVIQVTHSMDDAAHSGRVFVLDQSSLLMCGTPAEVFRSGNAATLHDCGLGLPRPLQWAMSLSDRGVAGLGEPLTTDELAARVAAACRGEAG